MRSEPQTFATPSDRIIKSRHNIPENPAPGNYVVVDVTHFSTTVVELLARGADYIHVTEERGDEFDFKREHPRTLIGGGRTDDYEPEEGYDFYNSPTAIEPLDVSDRPIAMTSSNGGHAVTALRTRGGDGVDVFVGGTLNAESVGRYLSEDDRPTYVVAAGHGGEPAVEDVVGATVIARYLDGDPPTQAEIQSYRELISVAKEDRTEDKPEVEQRAVDEFSSAFNDRTVVPKLDGQRLTRVTRDG